MATEWTSEMQAWVDRTVASWPPISDEQCEQAGRIIAASLAQRDTAA